MVMPNVKVTETDVSTVKLNPNTNIVFVGAPCAPSWQPGMPEQSIGRALRGPAKIKVKIARIGRYYTDAKIADIADCLPRKFKHNTRRAAKKFWQRPIRTIGSAKQMVAIYGKPRKQFAEVAKVYDALCTTEVYAVGEPTPRLFVTSAAGCNKYTERLLLARDRIQRIGQTYCMEPAQQGACDRLLKQIDEYAVLIVHADDPQIDEFLLELEAFVARWS